jgi:hypothetical protein
MDNVKLTTEQFDRACSLLPEGTMWGEHLTPEIVLHIAQASRRSALEEAAQMFQALGKDLAAMQIRALATETNNG